jgi:hypothetical protein
MSFKLRTLLWLSLPLTLQACATPTPILVTSTPPVDLACQEFPRITFDRKLDTLPTIAQIKAYNAGRDKLCGVGK